MDMARARYLPFLLLVTSLACNGEWGMHDGQPGLNGPQGDDDDDDFDEPVCDGDYEVYPNHALPPGGMVRDGILADLTPAGLQFIETTAMHLDTIVIPMESMTQELGEYVGCDVSISISDLLASAEVRHLVIDPISHGLAVELGLDVWINSAASPFHLSIDADGGLFDVCSWLDETCNVWVEPMTVSLDLTVWLELVDPGNGGPPFLDAIVSTPTHNLPMVLTEDRIGLDDCLIATLNDILNLFGTDLIEILLDEASGELFAFLEQDLPAAIEAAIEDGFDAAMIHETFDVNGTPLAVDLEPGGLMIEPSGVRMQIDGAFDAPLADCMVRWDTNGSPLLSPTAPAMDAAAHHHLGVHLSDDLVNAALYAVWRGGLLCFDADPAEMGIPVDTAILALLVDEEDRPRLERIWMGESQPLTIQTVPRYPPMHVPDGPHAVDVEVENLGLDFYALLQDRQARVLGLEVDITGGAELAGAGDGTLVATIVLDTDGFHPHVCHNDLAPDLSGQIEANFDGLITTMVAPLLDDLLADVVIGPLQMGGVGLTSINTVPTGPDGAYVGALTELGLVSGGSLDVGCGGTGDPGGCSSDCDDAACDSSCDLAGRRSVRAVWVGNVALLLLCVGMVAAHRRR
jgi:hypothetical protein